MTDENELTYAAIITLTLPGMETPQTVTVTLTPPDLIEPAPGRVKALRDCTLADLQAFADKLEADIWAEYRSETLARLGKADSSQVRITVLNQKGDPLTLAQDDLLAHAILLEDESGPADDEAVAPAGDVADEEAGQPPAPDRPPVPEVEETAPAVAPPPPDPIVEEPVVEGVAEPTAEADLVEEAPKIEGEDTLAPRPRLRIAGLRRPVGHATTAATDILINEAAYRDAQAHALTSLDREVAGMLIGPRPEKQPDGRYVTHVTDIIIAKHTRMQGASVTYTPESWRYVTDKLAERYPDEEAVIVGWYHTHPGFGIFLSGMDLFIHQNFFTQKWHVALVLDPQACKSGFFSWNRERTRVEAYDFPWPSWAPHSW